MSHIGHFWGLFFLHCNSEVCLSLSEHVKSYTEHRADTLQTHAMKKSKLHKSQAIYKKSSQSGLKDTYVLYINRTHHSILTIAN